jgi:voltage-gated potassium channel
VVEELLSDPRFEYLVLVVEKGALPDDPVMTRHADHLLTLAGDYTRVDCLREAGIERAQAALLLADASVEERTAQDRDARTVLAAMLVEKLNPAIHTTVQLLNRDNEASLRQIGVEQVIVSDEYVGHVMATVTRHRGIATLLDEMLTATYGYDFYRLPVPEAMVGLAVGEAMGVLKRQHDATLLAVDVRDAPDADDPHRALRVNPPADLVLEARHVLLVAASAPPEGST